MLLDYNVLHIQHELSFFKHNELTDIIMLAKSAGKKVIVTVHTAPAAQYVVPHIGGLGPRSLKNYAKQVISSKRFVQRYVTPLKEADLIIVHNKVTKHNLASYGVSEESIEVIKIPVPHVDFDKSTNEIRTNLNHQKGDVIFCSVGFISRMKGVSEAIKALMYLPDNFKLAIIGGVHPDGGDESLYNELTDLIFKLDLVKRVYITGYIEEDENLNSLIRECDVCVYPYDKNYYSYVSSAAINNAIGNHKPVIAYPTRSFIEINSEQPVVTFTKSSNYYELAREIRNIELSGAEKLSTDYAGRHAYNSEAANFINIYRKLISE